MADESSGLELQDIDHEEVRHNASNRRTCVFSPVSHSLQRPNGAKSPKNKRKPDTKTAASTERKTVEYNEDRFFGQTRLTEVCIYLPASS